MRIIEEIVFLYDSHEPNTILAFVSLKDNVLYPEYGIPPETYYPKVDELLSQLKRLLNNDQLTLYPQ